MTAAPTALEKLKAAMHALPVLEDRRHMIDRLADSLKVIGILAAVNDQPWARPTGSGQALKELEELLRRAGPLAVHIRGMHGTAHDALERGGKVRHWRRLASDLEDVCRAADAACTKLASLPAETKKPGGAPKKRQAERVTGKAAKYYTALTGRQPTLTVDGDKRGHRASGTFLTFLESVFAAFDIDASPEAQAKALLKKTRKI
jgi:hypothetical protein